MAVIVIPPLRLVYWPIPKNACTSLKRHFARIIGIDKRSPNIHRAPFQTTQKPLRDFRDLVVVRNPFSRFYSLWVNKIAPGHPTSPHFVNDLDVHVFKYCMNRVRSGMSFESFANVILNDNIPLNPHWATQSSQVPVTVISYCRLERISHILGLFLPKENVSHIDTPWMEAYTPELMSLVHNYYREDFQRFQYE
jgi:hypothetical protein